MADVQKTCAECTSWLAAHWPAIADQLPGGAFWSNAWSTAIGAVVGAALAFELERRRRRAERIRDEIGKAHQLAFLLLHRLEMLEGILEAMYLNPQQRLQRQLEWTDVEPLDGLPRKPEPIPTGDYQFLIDGREHHSNAPLLLSRVKRSTFNVGILCDRLARRSRMWAEWKHVRIMRNAKKGDPGLPYVVRQEQLEKDLHKYTVWAQEELAEEIEALHKLFGLFYNVMQDRYPNEKFVTFRSKRDGGPPLGTIPGPPANAA